MRLLFELLLEELPNSEMVHLEDNVLNLLDRAMKKRSIEYRNACFYLTPRRMTLKFEFDEEIKQPDKKIVGPPKNICYRDGKPTKALEGFLKKNNATESDIVFEQTKKGEYVAIVKKGKQFEAKPFVIDAIGEIFFNIHFYKKMRWGRGDFEYVRPVHNVLFTIDDGLIDFSFMGKKAVNYTYGHRFMSKGKIGVSYDSYEEKLKDSYVIVDQKVRRGLILNELKSIAEQRQAKLIYDEDLLNEVVNLTEYPVVVIGSFEERFLKLPKEVLITSMKDHQRYFAFMKDGKLLNIFAAISNIKTGNMDVIRNGYERVLRARFSDAEFFFEEDKKHRLEEFVEKLDQMLFHEKLGTQLDRTKRLVELSGYIAKRLGFSVEKAKRAAYLSKADLLTQMVYEFPELQGVMGREYALINGEDGEVAQAIYEQYLPKENELPHTEPGICLSVADKVDIIVGGFFSGLKPTGAKDPYGLRRAALGIIRTLIENKLHIDINDVLKKSAQLYKSSVDLNEIVEFFKVRFRNLYDNYPYDLIESVLHKFDDIYDAYLKLLAIDEFVKNDTDKESQFVIKRVFNIVKGFKGINVKEDLFKQNEERRLFGAIRTIEDELDEYLNRRDYLGLLNRVVSIKAVINAFFDEVLVMDKDERLRNNRLGLLNRLKQIVLNVADFERLEI